MGVTMSHMVEAIDLGRVLGANFRFSLARLVYLYQRSNVQVRGELEFSRTLGAASGSQRARLVRNRADCRPSFSPGNARAYAAQVRDQISFVLRCLDTPQFIDTLRHKMLAMVKAYELELDISSITEDASKLGLAGTFQQALHQQFTEALAAMFAIVLSHMARPATNPRLGSSNAPS